MHTTCLAIFIVFFTTAYAWDLYANDLRGLIYDKDTRNKLKDLSKKKDVPRSQLQQELQQILQGQPQMVQVLDNILPNNLFSKPSKRSPEPRINYTPKNGNKRCSKPISKAYPRSSSNCSKSTSNIAAKLSFLRNLSLSRDQAEDAKKDLVKGLQKNMRKAVEKLDKNYYKDPMELKKD